MRINTALLCEAATVREGLLHILGGGVSRVSLPHFPGPVAASLALQVGVHASEAALPHVVRVALCDESGSEVARTETAFQVTGGQLGAGEDYEVHLAAPFYGIELPHPGRYELRIFVDQAYMTSLFFSASQAPSEPVLQGGPDT